MRERRVRELRLVVTVLHHRRLRPRRLRHRRLRRRLLRRRRRRYLVQRRRPLPGVTNLIGHGGSIHQDVRLAIVFLVLLT